MKKKILALILCAMMAATAVVGGTLAYFTDTEKATNTMTIGNVQINIDEFQKNEEGDWEPFEDKDFTLYPVDWNLGTTYRNKVVYTANTSPSKDDAYIRTIVLIEVNNKLTAEYKDQDDCCFPGLHYNYFGDAKAESVINGKTIHGVKETKLEDKVTVNGNEYWVVLFEEVSGKAVPYDEALFSLNGVFMDKNITSEQIAGWYDYDAEGNCINTNVDIIVFSQAIQTEGFDNNYNAAMTALGEINQDNLTKWLNGDTTSNIVAAPEAKINDWAN